MTKIKGAIIIVLNEKNEILIAKRAPLKQNGEKRIAGDRWAFVGGKKEDKDKSLFDTAVRELREELHLSVNKDCLFFLNKKNSRWDKNQDLFECHTFFTKIINPEIILNKENTEYKFIKFENFSKYNIVGYEEEEIFSFFKKMRLLY